MSGLEPKLEPRADRLWAALKILAVSILVVTIGSVVIPALYSSQRASNERQASTALKAFASAEADFRANDRDVNQVNDFWTADVKGIYTLTSAAERGANPGNTRDPSIKLIELSVAAADGDGTFVPAGGENVPLSTFTGSKARGGYWFMAMLTDQSVEGSERSYMQDTKGTPPMGPVHHSSRFGFAAFPDSPSSGKCVFVVNEYNTVFKHTPKTTIRLGTGVPPGRNGLRPGFQHWPDDTQLKCFTLSGCMCPECR